MGNLINTVKRNSNKPAPRWYRKFKKVFSNTENFVIGILLVMGYGAESTLLLIIKLSTSFLLNNLDTIIANGEEYTAQEKQEP
jgi:hypothetical protein